MKYIVVHKNNSEFNKNIEILRNEGFNIEEVFSNLKMFVLNEEHDSKLEKLKSFDFIEYIENDADVELID